MLAANEEIGWHPEHIKHGRFGKWLENNVDWALSRDRYWGTPLPIWECDAADCEERFCAGSIADLRERGAEVPDDLHRPYIDEVVAAPASARAATGRCAAWPAVIDAWFDSGSMPWAQFHYPFENEELFEERFPADFICEAIDQTRGWFYTLLAESVLLFDTSSYRNVVCLGLILDPEGQKMSKSRGNVVEPWDVIDRHGADAFRWYYFTSQQPWAGYRFSVDTVGEAVRQFLLTLWNTYSFWVLYANASRASRPASCPTSPGATSGDQPSPTELDRWARLPAPAHDRDGPRADGRASTAPRAAGRSPTTPRSSPTGTCASTAAASGTGDLAALRDAPPLPGRGQRSCSPRSRPSSPTRSTRTCARRRGRRAVRRWTTEPDSVHLCDFPRPTRA